MKKKSIFLISHSKKITDGIKEMIEEMQINTDVTIHSLGGTADDMLGSDPLKVMEAAQQSRNAAAILVFADIGSATLSAEMVHDMLDEELQKKYYLVDASLVEGAFAAAITAGVTDDITQIIKEAKKASVKGWD